MLVDYHMHLAPDDQGLDDAALAPERLALYVDAARAAGVDEICLTEHCHRFREAAGMLDNPFWEASATADLARYGALLADARDAGQPVRVGIELDWLPGRERELAALAAGIDADLVLGSVHWLGERAVDHPDYAVWDDGEAVESVWRRYYGEVRDAVGAGLFDVLAHLDLPKVFGHRPPVGALQADEEATLDAIAEAGVAVEISTAGLHKPIAEAYPTPELLRSLRRREVPITLASDAHRPEHVGRDYDVALRLAADAGYTTVTAFRGREPRQEPLG